MSIALAIFGLGMLIVLHEGGHFLVARLCGMRVERFAIFFGKPLLSRKFGDTIYQLGWLPLGGFVQITGLNPHESFDVNDPYMYPNRPRWMRAAVLAAGPGANYLTAFVLAFIVCLGAGTPTPTTKIDEVFKDSAADAAGLRAGDVLVQANATAISKDSPINKVIAASQGAPVAVKIVRDNKPMELQVTPRKQSDGNYLIGIRLGVVRLPASLGQAIKEASILPFLASVSMLEGLGRMISGKEKADLRGPVGIAREMASAANLGILRFIEFAMFLSIYLGLFNLLPVPALDGARILFIGINKVLSLFRWRAVKATTEATVHSVGLMLLLGMFVLVTFNDIRQIFMKFVH